MMTKKDYLLVGETMKRGFFLANMNCPRKTCSDADQTYLSVVREVAAAFAESDPKFVANDFLTAAGIAGLLVKS